MEESIPGNEHKALQAQIEQLKAALESKAEGEKEIRERLQKYELAANGASDGLWDWNMKTNEVFISEPWSRMLGYDISEAEENLLGWESLLHPGDKEGALDAFYGYIKGDYKNYDIEFRLRHKDGSYRWIHSKGTVLRDSKGRPYRISGSHTDITERKMAEEALIQSEQKYRNLFENSLVGMFRADIRTGEILEANGKAWEIFGLEPQKGVILKDFFTNEREREETLKELLRSTIIENHELQVKRWDGKILWVSLSACFYPEEGFLECVLKDVTDTKQNLLELQKVNFELDNFVYHASHDLRSPLRSILGLVNILRIETNEKAKQNVVDMIEGSIKRLDNLVMDLLSMSRNNRINDAPVEINFMNEINYSFTSFYHVADTQNLALTINVRHGEVFVSDITRIRIILNNLISNAIKYRSYSRDLSFIHIDVSVSEKEAVFIIEDNGEGIPASKVSTVFDMFVRASESSEGSGLGLYIVKNVLEKLNGEIAVESEEDVGTKFVVRLPNKRSAAAQKAAQ
ncbi:PAS domain-containing sensor histidine kinase [Nafulsella turpanensis]|uniref:PAS domain-containing sensor histidine kinase n=1 Tax=Nafulsella turpanensis TaxID=1265690 RepID=UPI0003457659|nr:PAS domain S-box protein [Nafulsella turpanensis]